MTAQLLDGERLAQRIKMELPNARRVSRRTARTPGSARSLVGDDPSSARYVEMKIEECKEIGVRSFDVHLPRTATQARDRSGRRPVQRRPRRAFDPGAAPAARRHQRGSRSCLRVNPDQGRRRPAPDEPRSPRHGCARSAAVHADRHRRVARGLRRARRGQARRHHRTRTHHRTTARAADGDAKRPNCNAAVTVVHTGVEDMAALTRSADVVVVGGRACRDIVTARHGASPGAAVVGAGTSLRGQETAERHRR